MGYGISGPLSAHRARIVADVLGGENPTLHTSYELHVSGVGGSLRARELRYFAEDEGPALVLEAHVAGRLPPDIEGRQVWVDFRIGDALIRAFTGECLRPQRLPSTTVIAAASAGYWLGRILLGNPTSFTDAAPSDAASPPDSLEGLSATWEVGVHLDREDFEATLESEGRYRDVLVYHTEDSGDITELARVPVDIRSPTPPPAGTTFPIEFTDESELALTNASEVASGRAALLREGRWTLSLTVPFIDPRVGRGDPVAVIENDGLVVRRWHMRVSNFTHDLIRKRASYTGEGIVVDEDALPMRPVPALSGALSRGVSRPLAGRDHRGMPYFSSSLAWVRRTSGGRVQFDSALAAAHGITVRRTAGGRVEINGL